MKGKIVFITGASSGIGEGCARKFASQGSGLILNARNVAKLEELKKEIQQYVKRLTAPYKYPRIVELVMELPKTISGKIRHSEIRKQDNQ